MLELAACPTTEDHHEMERTIYGEIVQMKRDRTVPVFCHTVIESMMSQYCGFNSVCGIVRYPSFWEPRGVEAQDCRAAKETARLQWAAKSFESPHPWDHHLALHLPERRPHG